MTYKTVSQFSKEWNISPRRIQLLCCQGRIPGVFKLGENWAIPENSKKPEDRRRKKKNMSKEINVIDLFCGAGGLSYGFEKAGCNVVLGVDNDTAALETFRLNHKNSKILNSDITKINYEDDIKKIINNTIIDIVVGGPPCQGFSIAGPRNFNDPRNRLYLSYIRLVKEIKPKAFVIENVPGLVSLFNGEIKDNIIKEFSEMGYNVNYKILCTSDFGVPQNRKRVIFVGILNNIKNKFEYPEAENQIITSEMALSDLPALTDTLGEIIQCYARVPQNQYQILMRKNSINIKNHIAALHSEKVKNIISLVPDGGNYKDLPLKYRNSRNFHVAWTRFDSKKPAPTIDTGHRHHFHYKYNRVPTVRECARLQSFPDDFVFYGNKTQQFRQVGNAVPPLMANKIARKILSCISEE